MMPKHTGEPDLALVGLALLIILGFMMWQDRPIQSPRPYDSASTFQHDVRITDHSYESWLWQDPFEVDPGEDKLHNKLHEIFKLNAGGQRLHGKELNESNDLCYCKNGLLTRAISNVAKNPNAPVKILVPAVEIKSNTVENKEFKTRYRYAVISGLIEAGYRRSEPHSINFCASQHIDGKPEYDVRWEHFSRGDTENLIVIWTTEENFFSRRITNSINEIKEENIFCLDPNVSDNVIKICPTSCLVPRCAGMDQR